MSVTKCRECGKEVSSKAKTCPHCGVGSPAKSGFFGSVVAAGVIFAAFLMFFGSDDPEPSTPEEKAARAQAEADARAEREARQAEDRRKGFHCLSNWDGSHRQFVNLVEGQLRNPDSFEHIETRVSPVTGARNHRIEMDFRAENGFGGMVTQTAFGTYLNDGCSPTLQNIK